MKIVRNIEELEKEIGSKSCGFFSITKKYSSDHLHDGHKYLIDYCKNNFDKTIISFWDRRNFTNIFYNNSFPNYPLVWDINGSIEWCKKNKVDYVLIPEKNYDLKYFDKRKGNKNINEWKEWVDYIWKTNEYPEFNKIENKIIYKYYLWTKAFIICIEMKKNSLNCNYVASWKNGFLSFVCDHYINNFTSSNEIILEPIKNENNLFYSSKHNFYTKNQIQGISKFEEVIKKEKYDKNKFLKYFAKNYKNYLLTIKDVEILKNCKLLNKNDVFISIFFSASKQTDVYPIYIKGNNN